MYYTRYGICHGRTKIVLGPFYHPGVKLSSEDTIFVINSLLVAISSLFCPSFCPVKQKCSHMGINMCIEVY